MIWKRLSDQTLLHMTKKELLEQVRVAEHNRDITEQQIEQQAKNVAGWEPVVRCGECEHYHDGTGWCNIHSHFTLNGEFCHPHESPSWKGFHKSYYCADGKRKD